MDAILSRMCQDSTVDNISGTLEPFTYLIAVSKLTISSTPGVPLLSADASVTVEKEVTNKQSSSQNKFEASCSTAATVTRTIDTKDGKTCSVDLKLHTCTAGARDKFATLQLVMYGSTIMTRSAIDTTSTPATPIPSNLLIIYPRQTHGHYRWPVQIKEALSNDDDRSSFAEMEGPISTEAHSQSVRIRKNSTYRIKDGKK
ncbi:hypothetical protein ARMGADRAFT_1074587 [Armillaria gallica]|uniref:Uncharacterized protein n=1 Tax=Armillaria gallica TaxID=47427 RepID=A0A2H3EKU7_ARMGA|nr:hypothetical protein ARMGADRAFT_1074587 [Armillaria gallica]